MDDRAERSSCPTMLPLIEDAFRGYEEDLFNKCFPAKGDCTITSFARNGLGIEAAQIEINARYRIVKVSAPFRSDREEEIDDLMARMRDLILAVGARFAKAPPQSLLF
jgi:hypothetical protein